MNKEKLKRLTTSAEQGNVIAQYKLGGLYDDGDVISQNYGSLKMVHPCR